MGTLPLVIRQFLSGLRRLGTLFSSGGGSTCQTSEALCLCQTQAPLVGWGALTKAVEEGKATILVKCEKGGVWHSTNLTFSSEAPSGTATHSG